MQKYPEHLYDPLRRKIAQQYIGHELRKLFPSVRDLSVWQSIDQSVSRWFEGNLLTTPVRIFWNGFHAIARGFRFKNLLPFLTSKNIEWEERTMPLTDLQFGFAFPDQDFLGPYPSVLKVKQQLSLPVHLRARNKLYAECKIERELTAFRDSDPIIVRRMEGKLRAIDGNRRLLLALLEGKNDIQAYVGEPAAEPEIFEPWVAMGFLQDLLFMHQQQPKLKTHIAQIIAAELKNSTSGRMEWEEMFVLASHELDKLMHREVKKYLK